MIDAHAGLQRGWSESKNNVVKIQEVAATDMKIVLQFINGELALIPEERLHSLVLATDRLQVLARYRLLYSIACCYSFNSVKCCSCFNKDSPYRVHAKRTSQQHLPARRSSVVVIQVGRHDGGGE